MTRREERRLLRLMERHGVAEFSYADADRAVALTLDELSPLHPEIRAMQAGRFLSRHPLEQSLQGNRNAAEEGAVWPRRVQAGETVGFLKIGPLLLPVTASRDAVLPRPLFEDGDIVGHGDILF